MNNHEVPCVMCNTMTRCGEFCSDECYEEYQQALENLVDLTEQLADPFNDLPCSECGQLDYPCIHD